MKLFRRTPRVPSAHRPALDPGERVLAWAFADPGDRVVVATNRGLWRPGHADRLGWHDVHKAVWSGRELTITPAQRVIEREAYVVVADAPAESFLLLDPGDVPEQVRARVTRSVAYTSHHALDQGGVRVVARRVPGVDGLTWTARYDPGTPTDDPGVVERIDALVATARSATTSAPI
ncbi:MAG TPA: hypothetical protein VF462_04310 [Micromonosporaceae bacterium]